MAQYTFDTPTRDYETGDLLLGKHGDRLIGVRTERHAITVAGSGMGKGAGLLIPNARLWPGNLLYIDPKGEGVEQTWEAREAMGQTVVALDPFRAANIPDRLRARFNPIDLIDLKSPRAREDLKVISDGLIQKFDPRAGHWDTGALAILTGMAAFAAERAPEGSRHLGTIRDQLRLDGERFARFVEGMAAHEGVGRLAQSAAFKLQKTGSEAGHFLSIVEESTSWLDSEPIRYMIEDSTFDLFDLKRGKLDVFLVLPPDLLKEHSRFLRMMVRCALHVMRERGPAKTLFLLDEFYSLGRIDEIAEAAGLMRGYGLQLWPFVQNLGQLVELYGEHGHQAFFANVDAAVFFGNQDRDSVNYISERIGQWKADDLAMFPPLRSYTRVPMELDIAASRHIAPPSNAMQFPTHGKNGAAAAMGNALMQGSAHLAYQGELAGQARVQAVVSRIRDVQSVDEHNDQMIYHHALLDNGKSRLPGDEIIRLVGRPDGATVAQAMIVFGKAGEVNLLRVLPHFSYSAMDRLRLRYRIRAASGDGRFELVPHGAGSEREFSAFTLDFAIRKEQEASSRMSEAMSRPAPKARLFRRVDAAAHRRECTAQAQAWREEATFWTSVRMVMQGQGASIAHDRFRGNINKRLVKIV